MKLKISFEIESEEFGVTKKITEREIKEDDHDQTEEYEQN